jgi:hypothetical protein
LLQEKSDLKKQHGEAQEAAEKDKGKVVVTFDLVGRKVIQCRSCRTASNLLKALGKTFGRGRNFATVSDR